MCLLERLANDLYQTVPGQTVPGPVPGTEQVASPLVSVPAEIPGASLNGQGPSAQGIGGQGIGGQGIRPQVVAIAPDVAQPQPSNLGGVSLAGASPVAAGAAIPAEADLTQLAHHLQGLSGLGVSPDPLQQALCDLNGAIAAGAFPSFSPGGYGVPTASPLPTATGATYTQSSTAAIAAIAQQMLQAQAVPPGAGGLSQLASPAIPGSAASSPGAGSFEGFDVNVVRRDFPILHQQVNGRPLIWFDNAATTQKPQCVIDAISRFYERDNSNIHRAAHTLAARATDAYESARETVQRFLGAGSASEILFVRGTTEAINLVAKTYGRKYIQAGDEIVLSTLEHHANIVPWQMLAQETGAVLKVIPVSDAGEVLLEEYARLLGPRTKLVSLTHVSNALGTILPVQEMTAIAHRHGAKVLIDGAQSVPHIATNVQALDCDFYVFSGHKLFAPTGIGVLYVKQALMEDMPPWQGGGNMIRHVTFERTIYEKPPAKFEAGTPNIADAVGLGAAIDYITRLGLHNLEAYEHQLTVYGTERLAQVPGLRPIGTAAHKVGVLSFVMADIPTEVVGQRLAQEGIAVRAGHHCAQPTMQRYGVTGTVRPSLAFYNTREEIDRLVEVLKGLRERS